MGKRIDLTDKGSDTKSLRMPLPLIDEVERIVVERSTEKAIYTFTDVAVDLLGQVVAMYREEHPRMSPAELEQKMKLIERWKKERRTRAKKRG